MEDGNDLSGLSMLELFRTEVGEQGRVLSEGVLALEHGSPSGKLLESLMRAAHSIKGAARLVGVDPVVRLAHVMEDVFVASINSEIRLESDHIDALLSAADTIVSIARLPDDAMRTWPEDHPGELENRLSSITRIKESGAAAGTGAPAAPRPKDKARRETVKAVAGQGMGKGAAGAATGDPEKDRVLRVTAERWNQLMGLAGEVKVEAGRLSPYVASLGALKRTQICLIEALDSLREIMDDLNLQEDAYNLFITAQAKAKECRKLLADKTVVLDAYDRRVSGLTERLHRETIITKMRPFSDGVHGLHRMVRDVARQLGKKVKLEINGLSTQVDRDVLEKIEAPLNHILRNAIDHGVEHPDERIKEGKNEQAVIRLTASHCDGMLSISVEDDGRGIDIERLRRKVVEKGLAKEDFAARLRDDEILEFMFLPNFSTRDEVTEISGRGVGLDVVLDVLQKMRGSVKVKTELGMGTRFNMQVPVTLSVISALIVEIAHEPYAFPMVRIKGAVRVPSHDLKVLENRQFITVDGRHLGIVGASHVLGLGAQVVQGEQLSIVIIGDRENSYGVVVDRFIGQMDLVVQSLDRRLGKVKDISSAALLGDGSPVLIVDVDDLVLSVEALAKQDGIAKVQRTSGEGAELMRKRVMVVDDSLTVREVERNLLEAAGYEVDTAVDGMDGWNALCNRRYDLVISDIDMPRMDGIELVRMIRGDRDYASTPVIIVSYKDREEDRRSGLEAGAD
ncbi:MAG: hybrid sensor histidine kinase/response regulator [Deltaproteobacteria bacterium]|nr:hybrid sensor histidine kinase/response regulator [Deltaproteobacteria bacterium]